MSLSPQYGALGAGSGGGAIPNSAADDEVVMMTSTMTNSPLLASLTTVPAASSFANAPAAATSTSTSNTSNTSNTTNNFDTASIAMDATIAAAAMAVVASPPPNGRGLLPHPAKRQKRTEVGEGSCPICGRCMPAAALAQHVNQHLDAAEDKQSLQIARELQAEDARIASASASSAPFVATASGVADEGSLLCPVAHCHQLVPKGEWTAHMDQHSRELAQRLSLEEEGFGQGFARENAEAEGGRAATTAAGLLAGFGASGDRRRNCDEASTTLAYTATVEAELAEEAYRSPPLVEEMSGKTSAVFSRLSAACRRSVFAGKASGARYVLSRSAAHYEQSRSGRTWDCGYRNIQILTSSLMQEDDYATRLFNGCGFVPNIDGIQAQLEAAWAHGFDREGAMQLGHKVRGTRKWIGTTECAALLRSYGIRTHIVDFRGAAGIESEDHAALVDWVWRYFEHGEFGRSSSSSCKSAQMANGGAEVRREGGSIVSSNGSNDSGNVLLPGPVRQTNRPPLYFQHQGHSRTVVGIERRREGKNFLLVLDPRLPGRDLARALANGKWEGLVKRSVHTLRMREYQLLHVDGIMGERELEQSKVIAANETFFCGMGR